jgi:hypothetical protein
MIGVGTVMHAGVCICALRPLARRPVQELDSLVMWYLCMIEVRVAVEMGEMTVA